MLFHLCLISYTIAWLAPPQCAQGAVSIRSTAFRNYISARDTPINPDSRDVTLVGNNDEWEHFQIYRQSDGRYVFVTAHSSYLSSQPNKLAQAPKMLSWELFTVKCDPFNICTIQDYANKYLSARPEGYVTAVSNNDQWEKFKFECAPRPPGRSWSPGEVDISRNTCLWVEDVNDVNSFILPGWSQCKEYACDPTPVKVGVTRIMGSTVPAGCPSAGKGVIGGDYGGCYAIFTGSYSGRIVRDLLLEQLQNRYFSGSTPGYKWYPFSKFANGKMMSSNYFVKYRTSTDWLGMSVTCRDDGDSRTEDIFVKKMRSLQNVQPPFDAVGSVGGLAGLITAFLQAIFPNAKCSQANLNC